MKDVYTLVNDCFQNVITACSKFGYNVSYLKHVVDSRAHSTNGKPVSKKEQMWASSWGNNGVIYINPNYKEVLNFFGLDMEPEKWFTFIIGYQVAKELYKNQWKETDKADIYRKANADKSFHSLYLDSLNGSAGAVINEETCCEYFANMICRSLGMK